MQHIELNALLDRRPFRRLQWLTLALCGAVALLDGFDVQIIAFAAPAISGELGIAASRLGIVFSSGLVGMTCGLLILGPFADRYGRKRTIEISVLIFGLFTLLTAWVDSFNQLLALRFAAGIGLGGALPNVVALMTEFAPARLRTLVVAAVFLGFPLGGMLIGALAGVVIPGGGWQSLFLLGGGLPLLLWLLLRVWLPESPRFLAAQGPAKREELRALLRRLDTRGNFDGQITLVGTDPPDADPARSPVGRLFDPGYGSDTLKLWTLFFVNLMVMYMLITWIPTLLVDAGHAFKQAAVASVYLNLGGALGPFLLAWVTVRYGSRATLPLFFALGALCVALLGLAGGAPRQVLALTFLAGFFVFATQVGINSLASGIYPTASRATGLGWALGIGRLGTVLGPLITGVMVQMSLGFPAYFGIFSGLLMIAGATSFVIRRQQVAAIA